MLTEVSCKANGVSVKVKTHEPLDKAVAAVTKLTRLRGTRASVESDEPAGREGWDEPAQSDAEGEEQEPRQTRDDAPATSARPARAATGRPASGGPGRVNQNTGQALAAPQPESDEKPAAHRPKVRIEDDYRHIEVGRHEIDFYRRKKRREFVKFLHQRRLKTGQDEFRYKLIRSDFQAATGIQIDSDRFEDDFFRGQPREFHLLFQLVDEKRGIYRIRI